ncbi:MAG: hypothetical protein WBW94_06850, partial [Anaerolineales bacterium]
MNLRFLRLAVIGLAAILISAACAPKATPPQVDDMATNIASGVSAALTQTAAAPTPLPSATSTQTPIPATITPTSGPVEPPLVVKFAACWFGPDSTYGLESNIAKGQRVQLLGIGSVPGWYIISNPYFHQPCWIEAVNLSIHVGTDMSQYPVITPIPLSTS